MRRSIPWLLLGVLSLVIAGVAEAAVLAKQVPVMRFNAETRINASPRAVWPHISVGRNLATWCPEWRSAANSKRVLSRTGDVLEFTDQWGNGGRSIVTYISPEKELRVAHEPNDGSYMCQTKIVLRAIGNATLVSFQEQYTDESGEKDRAATTRRMQEETAHALEALKASVERRR